VSARLRHVDEMFQDAENRLRYDRHTLVDLFAAVPLRPALEAYVGVTNAFDETYIDDLLTLERLGAPRQVRVGLRFRTGPTTTPAASRAH
jgi:outer membrane receptor protein involved in Fe transport